MQELYGIEVRENPIVQALVDAMNPEHYMKIENAGEKRLSGIFNGLEYQTTLSRCMGSFLIQGFIHSNNITISKSRNEAAIKHSPGTLNSVIKIMDWDDVNNIRDEIEDYFLEDFKTRGYPITIIAKWCIDNHCVTRGFVKALRMMDMEISNQSSESTLVIKAKEKTARFNFNSTTPEQIYNFFY